MKILIVIISLIIIYQGCSIRNEQPAASTDYISVRSDDPKLKYINRSFYYDSLLFTGKISEVKEGDTSRISVYKDGKLNGKEVIYYSAGKIKEERYYTDGNKTGEHKGWWENGKLKFVYHFKDDVFNGNVKVWNVSGMLFNDFNYIKGQEEGLQQAWFPNGDVQANYVAKNNRKYGITGVKNCQTLINDISAK